MGRSPDYFSFELCGTYPHFFIIVVSLTADISAVYEVNDNININFNFSISGTDASNYTMIRPSGITNTYTPAKGTDYTVNSNDRQNTDFAVTDVQGRELPLTNTAHGTWSDTPTVTGEGAGVLTFYVRNTETVTISLATTEDCKIYRTAPSSAFREF